MRRAWIEGPKKYAWIEGPKKYILTRIISVTRESIARSIIYEIIALLYIRHYETS